MTTALVSKKSMRTASRDQGVVAKKNGLAQKISGLKAHRESQPAPGRTNPFPTTGGIAPPCNAASSDTVSPFETGPQLLHRILIERRTTWQGRGKYHEPAAPDTPQLPTLPKAWAWGRLEQVTFITGGLTKNPKRDKVLTKLPYLRVANVYANQLRLEEIEHIGVDSSELPKLLLRADDLLIVEGNGSKDQIGRLAIWDDSITPCVHQNHLIKARPIDPRLSKWILYWLMSPAGRHFVEQVASSTSGLYTLSVNKIGDLVLPLAPLPEQERIVAEIEKQFTRLDAGIASLKRVQANLKRYRASVLKAACEGSLVACEMEKWSKTTIADSVRIIDYRGRTPPFSNDGIPHLRSQNVRNGRLIWEDLAFVSPENYQAYMTRGLPQKGDLLFTTEAPMGEVALAPEEKFSVAQRLMILRPFSEQLDGRFLMIHIQSPAFQAQLRKSGTGSTVTGVSSRNFKLLPLLVPPLAEQTRIVAEVERRLSVIDELETLVIANLKRASRLRQSILQNAFTGSL